MIYPCGLLLASALVSGCDSETQPTAQSDPLTTRPVATVYHVRTGTGAATCYKKPDGQAISTTLNNGQVVDLVSVKEGTLQRNDEFWLHVYPRLGHRPSCYINTRYLVPSDKS